MQILDYGRVNLPVEIICKASYEVQIWTRYPPISEKAEVRIPPCGRVVKLKGTKRPLTAPRFGDAW